MPSYSSVSNGYANLWDKAVIQEGDADNARKVASRIFANKDRYIKVAERISHPELWPLIGALHDREDGGNFSGVLHNGEHIIGTGRKTSLVPAGRGPFSTWENSAVDALTMPGKEWHKIDSWPIARWLYEAEKFNGFGYYSRGINSPYVWSGTSLQQRGKYVADGVWSANAWDNQLGVAVVLKALFADHPELEPGGKPATIPTPADVGPSEVKRRKTFSADVVHLQKLLGFSNDEQDGYFGIETEKAVKWAQRRAGIEVDGIVGEATWAMLEKTYNKSAEHA